MSRALYVLRSAAERERASRLIAQAPSGTRVEFRGPSRTLDQNSMMWSILTKVSAQKEHFGRKIATETWKCIFMHAVGNELKVERSLDGEELVPIGNRSSELSKAEMSELLEFMIAWCAENGVKLHDSEELQRNARAAA